MYNQEEYAMLTNIKNRLEARRHDGQADSGDLVQTVLLVAGFAIAAILATWAAYAFAGAGLIRRLPLMRTALVLISAIYLARALLVFHPPARNQPDLPPDFMIWSSLIVLVFGLSYAVGTWQAWHNLSKRKDA